MLKFLAVSLVAAAAFAAASVMLMPDTPGARAQMPTPTPVYASAVSLAIDCDIAAPGVQDNCNVILGAPSVDVGVVLVNGTGGPITLAAFDAMVRDSDTSRMNPPAVLSGTNLDRNPNFNDPAVPGPWSCDPPVADTGMAGANQAESLLSCNVVSAVTVPSSPPGLMLAVVHYTVPGGATAGPVTLDFSYGDAADENGVSYGYCITGEPVTLLCAPATVNLAPPPPGSTATFTPTITPTPTNTATPTATPTSPGMSLPPSATPTAAYYVAVDCDPSLPGIQVTCSYPLGAGAIDVDVYVVNNYLFMPSVAAFNFELHAPDLSRLSPLPGLDFNFNGNPDFNQTLPGNWDCAGPPPNPNLGFDGPGKAVSYLSCTDPTSGAPLSPGGQLKLGTVHYAVPPGALPGSVPLVLSSVSVADRDAITLVACDPLNLPPAFPIVVGPCVNGAINLFEPPTATPTNTPANTPTPTPGVSSTVSLALDCDLVTPGVQNNCNVVLGAPTVDVGIVLVNSSGAPLSLSLFDVTVRDSDTSRLNPPAVLVGSYKDRNPDFNDSGVPGTSWVCNYPVADTGAAGPGQADSHLLCSVAVTSVMIPASPPGLTLAVIHYAMPGGATAGPVALEIVDGGVAGHFGVPYGVCGTPPVTLSCAPATVNLVPLPPGSTATFTPTATSASTNTPTPTATPPSPGVSLPPPATPAEEFYVAVDCDVSLPGIQVTCSYLLDAGTIDVDVYVVSNGLLPETLAAFAFEVHAPDLARLSPLPGLDLNLNGNPDFNQALAGLWGCAVPNPNTGIDGPGKAVSYLGCLTFPTTAPLPAGGQLKLGTVHYAVPPGALTGSVPLVLSNVSASNSDPNPLLNCDAQSPPPVFPVVVGPCVHGVINLFEPPTAPPTNTPTPTPAVGMAKVPEGSVASGNLDLSVPKANLFLCITGPCTGPGEGDLVVVEHVSNITTGDSNGDMVQDGLGAYEFNVEYDNFVIQSVNPSDIVFSAGGAGASRGPASCSFSLVLENVVRFGCVTTGPTPNGPTGDFDLAELDLIPHPDLANDLFPGNDNGVPTVIKDNGCELADVFGHPVLGSVSGGLLPACGDLAVTVRILEGDLNLDCQVDVTDEQLIGVHYASAFGSAYYSTWFDLEPRQHDLDIDIKDLQKVFGRDGSTCQQPIPQQTPVDPPAPFG